MTDENDRNFPRYYTVLSSADLPLMDNNSKAKLDGRIVDVSRDGIGFLSNEPIDPGLKVTLTLENAQIEFTAVYCTQDIINPDTFRVGLTRQRSAENLVTVFHSHDLLEDKNAPH